MLNTDIKERIFTKQELNKMSKYMLIGDIWYKCGNLYIFCGNLRKESHCLNGMISKQTLQVLRSINRHIKKERLRVYGEDASFKISKKIRQCFI